MMRPLLANLLKQNFQHRTFTTLGSQRNSAIKKMSSTAPDTVNMKAMYEKMMNQFNSVWPLVKHDLIEFTKVYDTSGAATRRFEEALEYNVPHGKRARGLLTVDTYQAMANNCDENDLQLAHVMGWCVELLQSIALIQDDIMDEAKMRRARPTWHLVDGVGLFAFNDSMMMLTGTFSMLRKYFGDKDYYRTVFELFNEIIFSTTVGQSLDVAATGESVLDFTMEKYEAISKNKTFYYTFYLPMALGMHMARKNNPEIFMKLQDVLLDISYLFQVQDDFIDIFGDPKVTGKVGTDIQDKKCTWFPAMFNQKATPEQKEILKACYGSSNPASVARARELFEEVGLVDEYKAYEENSVKKILQKIEAYHELPSGPLLKIVGSLCGRKF